MKKSISILALLAIIATGAFAQGFSLGGGALLDWSLVGNGAKISAAGQSYAMDVQNLSIGGFVFFDATYAELDASFAYGLISAVLEGGGTKETEDGDTVLQVGFSLLGKYPIGVGGFNIFPLLGADYNMVLSYKNKDGQSVDKPGDYSQIGFLGGLGLDLPFSRSLFLRAEALFHLRLPMKAVKDLVGSGVDLTYGMGPRIKVGLGYKL